MLILTAVLAVQTLSVPPQSPQVQKPTAATIVIYPATVGDVPVNKPQPIFLGRDMTPTTEHIKPKVVPPVVHVSLQGTTPPAPASFQPVHLAQPTYDGTR